MYLAYCDCRRPNGETMKIVACFTQGDADYLMVGRNGVFYDRKGRDWDATIVRIVENPISIRQAFWAPYKKALKFVEDQIARFAQAKQKASDEHVETTAARVTDTATAGKPVAPAPVDVGRMVGIIAALGVGIGALGRSGRRSPSARRSRPARDAPSTILRGREIPAPDPPVLARHRRGSCRARRQVSRPLAVRPAVLARVSGPRL
jgi:hypothetical protein